MIFIFMMKRKRIIIIGDNNKTITKLSNELVFAKYHILPLV